MDWKANLPDKVKPVVRLGAHGYTPEQIADELCLATCTIRNYIQEARDTTRSLVLLPIRQSRARFRTDNKAHKQVFPYRGADGNNNADRCRESCQSSTQRAQK